MRVFAIVSVMLSFLETLSIRNYIFLWKWFIFCLHILVIRYISQRTMLCSKVVALLVQIIRLFRTSLCILYEIDRNSTWEYKYLKAFKPESKSHSHQIKANICLLTYIELQLKHAFSKQMKFTSKYLLKPDNFLFSKLLIYF